MRIFESGKSNSEFSDQLSGIRDIFSLIHDGHMAVAIGERALDGNRFLWLFRNFHRPLWMADLRELLGQVFFFSVPDIWDEAVQECFGFKNITKSQKLIELPDDEIWCLKISDNNLSVQRFEVRKEEELIPWVFDGNKISFPQQASSFQIITPSDVIIQKTRLFDNVVLDEFPLKDLHVICNEIIEKINDVRQGIEQSVQDQSMSTHEFNQFLLDLDQQNQEMQRISSAL